MLKIVFLGFKISFYFEIYIKLYYQPGAFIDEFEQDEGGQWN